MMSVRQIQLRQRCEVELDFPVAGLSKADFEVNINNKNIRNFTVQTGSNGLPEITFPQKLSHQANPDRPGASDTLIIKLTRAATQRASTNLPAEYNYKELGETWSAPEHLDCQIQVLETQIF